MQGLTSTIPKQKPPGGYANALAKPVIITQTQPIIATVTAARYANVKRRDRIDALM
jgi:hypothetical protein